MNSKMENEPSKNYAPTAMFRLAALLLVVASVWMGLDVWRQPNVINIIVFVGLVIIALGTVVGAFARADFDGDTVVYRMPLRPTHTIQRKQIISATREGRWTKALVIGYHPRAEDGRIELERAAYVNFVPLENQDDLLERLVGTSA
jgi:hypothetical protein